MSYILTFEFGRKGVQITEITRFPLTRVRVYIGVSGIERGHVLEEVGSLTRVYPEILKTALHYQFSL